MTKKAISALGCLWGPDDYYSKLRGVVQTAAGYSGGNKENPTYEGVCSGDTDHSEAVEVEYDPEKISYKELLKHFWNQHDPTLPSKTQYRSSIFYHDANQQREAEASRASEQVSHKDQILTDIRPVQQFWRAEEYHQKYYQKNNVSNVC